MSFYHPPGGEQFWVGTMFAVGFLLTVALGLYLAFSILWRRD